MIITVKRFDPSKDAAPYYTDYEVPYLSDYMTLLQGLVYIHENLEPLAFDYSCRGRLCGRCAMMMNGEPVLACVTLVEDGKSYTVEPLANMPVVKDLIVDKSKINSEISKSYRRARIKPLTIDDLQTYDMSVADELAAIQYCARCQLCTTGCPARQLDSEYIGPSHMLAIAFRHFDPYDQADRIVEAVQGGLWSCIMCGKCTELCNANEIDHVSIWQMLRDAAEARGMKL